MIQHQIGLGKVFQYRDHIPAGHIGCDGLNLCLRPLQTAPEALKGGFSFSPPNMNDPSASKIKDNGDVLAFLAEIDLVYSKITHFLKVKPSVFST